MRTTALKFFIVFLVLWGAGAANAAPTGDWKVTTSAGEKQAYLWDRLYGGIATQDRFNEAFRKAMEKDDGPLVVYLLKLAVRKKLSVDWTREDGSWLHYAAKQPECKVIRSLLSSKKLALETGVEKFLNAQDGRQRTPLHSAIYSSNLKCTELLVSAKDWVDIEMKDIEGNTALAAALTGRNFVIVRAVMARNPKMDISVSGKPVVDYAFEKDNPLAVKLLAPTRKELLVAKVTQGAQSWDLLQTAAMFGAYRVAEWLMREGFHPMTVSNGKEMVEPPFGKAPFQLAVVNMQWNVVEAFLEKYPQLIHAQVAKDADLVEYGMSINEPRAVELAMKYRGLSEMHYIGPNSAYQKLLTANAGQKQALDFILLKEAKKDDAASYFARNLLLGGKSVGIESILRRDEYDRLLRLYDELVAQGDKPKVTRAHLDAEWQSFRYIYTVLDVALLRGNEKVKAALIKAGASISGPNRITGALL